MTITFLVAIKEIDLSTLASVSDEINDALSQHGFDVESVKPWARPSTAPTATNPFGALPSMVEPQIPENQQ